MMYDADVNEVVEVNIGLQQSQRYGRGPGAVDVGDALLRLQPYAAGGVVAARISMVGEPTLLLRFIPNVPEGPLIAGIHRVSAALLLECIAVYYPGAGAGTLVGPYANDNGPFDRAFFQRI